LEPEIIDFIPPGKPFDMPELFKAAIAHGRDTAAFPVREYWLEVGRMDDLERANGEYSEVFK